MNEIQSLIEQHKFIRNRLLKLLGEIEESGQTDALTWMLPFGEKGRAHIAWQMMHCAATIEKYLHVKLENAEPEDPELVEKFGGGSVPDPNQAIKPDQIKKALDKTLLPFYDLLNKLNPENIHNFPPGSPDRSYRDILYLLNWHEASHEGQCRIIWNSFKADRGIK